MLVAFEFHIDRCNRNEIERHLKSWEDCRMSKDVDMGVAGSFTMIVLVLATTLLLRSFYKRYNRMTKRDDSGNS